jgi:hypothetical protein
MSAASLMPASHMRIQLLISSAALSS